MVTFLGFLAGQLGSSGFSDALLPLKPDFRLNPNDLTQTNANIKVTLKAPFSRKGLSKSLLHWGVVERSGSPSASSPTGTSAG